MNKRFVKNFLMFVMGVGLLVFLYPVYLWTNQAQFSANLQLAALLSGSNVAVVLDPQTKTFGCQVQGPLPDHGCTPGAVFKNTTKDQICVTGYTKTVRSVSTSLRKKVFAEYGIDYDQPFGSYEADHLIPLALGGNNDISNLFPEAASPYPGFKEKFKKSKKSFDDIKSKAFFRVYNLATRLDLGHSKRERKKKKS